MDKKIRIVRVRIVPTIFLDDGENLIEMSVDPLDIPGSEVDDWAETGFKDALVKLRSQAEHF